MATSKAAADKPPAVPEPSPEPGLWGDEVDPTPNEHYSVAGVLAGLPTPESDQAHGREVRKSLDDAARVR